MMTTVDSSSTSMTANVDPVGLLDVPAEILQTIFKRVSHKDRLNLRLTCRTLREQASDPHVLSLDMMKGGRKFCLNQFRHNMIPSLKHLMPNIVALRLIGNSGKCGRCDLLDEELLLTMKASCVNLESLALEVCRITSSFTATLPERLSVLTLINTRFDTTRDLQLVRHSTLQELRFEDGSAAVLQVLAGAFANLKVLRLIAIADLSANSVATLEGQLQNLVHLHLVSLEIDDQVFRTIARSFSKLTELSLEDCRNVRGSLAALEGNVLLEKLIVKNCGKITKASLITVFGRLVNLKHVDLEYCGRDNRPMAVIFEGLPRLQFLRIRNTSISSDVRFRNVIDHPRLNEIVFDGIELSDRGMMLLAPRMPNLTKLNVTSIIFPISDEGFLSMADALPRLQELKLGGTSVTDNGLVRGLAKLTRLRKLDIESVRFSEVGMLPAVDWLANIPEIEIGIVNRGAKLSVKPTRKLAFINLSSRVLVKRILAAFAEVSWLHLEDCRTLTTSDVDFLQDHQPRLERLTVYSHVSHDVALKILDGFSSLKELVLDCVSMTDITYLKVADRQGERALRRLILEGDGHLPSEQVLVTIAPILCSIRNFRLNTHGNFRFCPCAAEKTHHELHLSGRWITDAVLLTFATNAKPLGNLLLNGTSVTLAGFREAVPHLTDLHGLGLNVSSPTGQHFRGDDALVVVNELLTSELIELTVRGESFTDAAFSKLGHHVDTLKRLKVARSSITLEGVTAWAPQLLKIGCVDFHDHPHLSKDFPTTDGINFHASDVDIFTTFDNDERVMAHVIAARACMGRT